MKKSILIVLLVTFMAVTVSAVLPPPTLGDVNRDGRVNIVDALLVAQFYVGPEPDGFIGAYADVDCNSKVDIVDALNIARYYVGAIDDFPCNRPNGNYVIRVSVIVDRKNGPDSEANIGISYTGDYEATSVKTPCVIGPYSEPFSVRLEAVPWFGSPLCLYSGVTISGVGFYGPSASSVPVTANAENPEIDVQFRYVVEREILTPMPQSSYESEL